MTAHERAAGRRGTSRAARSDHDAPSPPASLTTRYRSLFVIGRGGMGSVEAAIEVGPPGSGPDLEDHEALEYDRVVALKRLLPDAARDKRRVDMFLREARLAALLDHPNVVSAYDYGELDGELFLAMEYVEGQPLSRVLRALADSRERMSVSVAAHVLSEVCRGLHAAHELTDPKLGQRLQLVHRDVSPQNVMIGYDGRVRLLDFGVAKIDTESVTRTGEVKGKTAYMSPEQAMGEPLDRRSDLFGVGAILFECIALRRMWGDGTDMDVIRKLALESPPKLDDCGVEVPQGMSALHARLVARDATDRPATAREVADALLEFVDDPEGAARELRAILEAHFAEQAREQRARLASSLRAIAPARASQPTESAVAGHSVGSMRAPPEVIAEAPAAPTASPAGVTSRGRLGIAAASLLLASLVVWRLSSPGQQTRSSREVEVGAATPTATPESTSAAPRTEATGASPSATPRQTSMAPTTSAGATPLSSVVPRSAMTTRPSPHPPESARLDERRSPAPIRSSPQGPPLPSKPPDIDDVRPF